MTTVTFNMTTVTFNMTAVTFNMTAATSDLTAVTSDMTAVRFNTHTETDSEGFGMVVPRLLKIKKARER